MVRYMKRLLPVTICLVLCVGLAACGTQGAVPPAPTPGNTSAASPAVPPTIAVESRLLDRGSPAIPSPGQVAPDFVYTFTDGTMQRLSDLRGRRVLLNFWATWCGPCEEEMPDLQRLANERSDVTVLAINKLELVEAIVPFAQERGLTLTLIANPDGDISERYGAKNIPISYFINSDGSVGSRHLGIMTYETMMEQIERLK